MSPKRPPSSGKLKIGVSTCFFHADPQRPIFKGKTLIYAEQSLTHWIMSQDALVYLIPPPAAQSPVTLQDLAAELDGLVLEGGSDVAPETYGETALRPEWKGDRVRDLYESALLREFVAQGKPVLGVCRGAQLINVAYGGTLIQDIELQVPKSLNHRDWDIYDRNFHSVEFAPGSKLAQLYPGLQKAKINTIHHQGLKDLGKGLKIEARSPDDGLIEAVRLESSTDWVFAVQWHPEFHDPSDRSLLDSGPILADFLGEVKKRRAY
jgi:putative glutamine amidotransferase